MSFTVASYMAILPNLVHITCVSKSIIFTRVNPLGLDTGTTAGKHQQVLEEAILPEVVSIILRSALSIPIAKTGFYSATPPRGPRRSQSHGQDSFESGCCQPAVLENGSVSERLNRELNLIALGSETVNLMEASSQPTPSQGRPRHRKRLFCAGSITARESRSTVHKRPEIDLAAGK